MDILAILVAHEHRAYQEALAGALPLLRPGVCVHTAPPGDLDAALLRLAPDLVICSDPTDLVRERARSWIALHPDGASEALVCVDGDLETTATFDLDALLRVVDRARALLDGGPSPD